MAAPATLVMSERQRDVEVGGAYPFAQLAKAFVTARGHADEDVRRGAVKRIDQWTSVLRGIASGHLRIGARAPAPLLGPAGVGTAVRLDYPDLAGRCFMRSLALAGQLENNPRPLGTVKNLAYAWRQMVFFLAMSEPSAQEAFAATARKQLTDSPRPQQRLGPALEGLATIIDGGSFDPSGRAGAGRRLLGWTTGGHWLLSAGR